MTNFDAWKQEYVSTLTVDFAVNRLDEIVEELGCVACPAKCVDDFVSSKTCKKYIAEWLEKEVD